MRHIWTWWVAAWDFTKDVAPALLAALALLQALIFLTLLSPGCGK